MMKYILVFICVFTVIIAQAQNPLHITIQNTTLAATDSVLPFWFAANRQGKIQASNSFLNVTDLYLGQVYKPKTKTGLATTWGGNFVAAFGETNYMQVNQAFAGLSLKGWEIKGGLFYDEIRYAGLSTSNGIIGRSQNPRPHPTIRLSTMGYKPVPFLQNWLSFKGEYDEGLLNDDRYVEGAHLHHKSLYLKIEPASTWDINLGLEHFVMWGGTSPIDTIGELPGWDHYFRYVLALPGNEDFIIYDQDNISGNQLGSYQLEVVKEFAKMKLTFYLSHPWEDNSGLNLHNWQDNILGLYLHLKKEKNWITDVLCEFTNIQQGRDSYFNHYMYRSGFTYRQQMLGSPLFYPVIISNGISMGIQSDRFFAHHLGVNGNLSEYVKWKGLLTYIQHLGTYSATYEPVQNQFSGLFEVQYINPGFPVEIGMAAGIDAGNTISNNFGIQFMVAKRW